MAIPNQQDNKGVIKILLILSNNNAMKMRGAIFLVF